MADLRDRIIAGFSRLTAAINAVDVKVAALISGGNDGWTRIKLAADYTNPLATFANVSDGTTVLTFTPPANSDWEMEASLNIRTTTIANLPRIGVNVGANAANGWGAIGIWQAGATAAAQVHANVGFNNNAAVVNAQIAAGGLLTANVPALSTVKASGRSGNSPQPITVQMAMETAGANIGFVKRGSFLKWRTI